MQAEFTQPTYSLLFNNIRGAFPKLEEGNVFLNDKSFEPIIQTEQVVFDSKFFRGRKNPFVLNNKVIISQGRGSSKIDSSFGSFGKQQFSTKQTEFQQPNYSLTFNAIRGSFPKLDSGFSLLGSLGMEPITQTETVVFDSKFFRGRKTNWTLKNKVIISQGRGSSKIDSSFDQLSYSTASNVEDIRTGGEKIKPYLDEILQATYKTAIDSRKGHSGPVGVLKEGFEQIKESLKDDFRPLDRQEIDPGEVTLQSGRHKDIVDMKTGKKIGEVPIQGTMPNP